MKKTLIVIDMQNDFIDGSLGTPEAQAIVDNVAAKIEQYRTAGLPIIFTRDTHFENYLETNEGKHLPVLHCVKGTHGWEISEKLNTADAVIIDKPTFGYNKWAEYPMEEIELVGLCTDICVVSNALLLKTQYPEINISVDASCCAGVTPASHEAAVTTMEMCQIQVTR